MEHNIALTFQGYFLFYLVTNLYLIYRYISIVGKNFDFSEIAFLLVFGYMLMTFIGIKELEENWK
jgi:hypothetical protein